MFKVRCRLYRLQAEPLAWVDAGSGVAVFQLDHSTDKVILLMQDKRGGNLIMHHPVHPDISLKANTGTANSWLWTTPDLAWATDDMKPTIQTFALKFRESGDSNMFRAKYDSYREVNRLKEQQARSLSGAVGGAGGALPSSASAERVASVSSVSSAGAGVSTPPHQRHSSKHHSASKTPDKEPQPSSPSPASAGTDGVQSLPASAGASSPTAAAAPAAVADPLTPEAAAKAARIQSAIADQLRKRDQAIAAAAASSSSTSAAAAAAASRRITGVSIAFTHAAVGSVW